MDQVVLVLGASGLFGSHAARAFERAGWQVRRYSRARGDMAGAAHGADLIVNALNPPAYHHWARLVPAITQEVLGAAQANGAAVLVPGNVYVFGKEPGPWGVATPHRAHTRKGRIRAQMEAAYRDAAARGTQVILLRGGDFLAPGEARSLLDMVVLKHLARGRITTMGPPSVPRAYAYLPDMARAAVMLAEGRANLASYEDVPFPGLTFSTEELRAALQDRLERPLRMRPFPWWAMRLASPVWELARELSEMRYLYRMPHRLDNARFAELLPNFRGISLPDLAVQEVAALSV
ncbi:epimerase [Defluviimonas sp. 20V17]|uniref:Membrane protein n=2 Tax=Allgaiera indica TaxID=765699 RepID=A0AAN4UNC2_9RHOB|nr:epimerase [Defluviimonas sp. 20V17]GHD98212.1 membrane protein [Allgaiera indica]SDW51587.1 dTDP-4-dehydrorhamnose reductase [Allgaiera indica]